MLLALQHHFETQQKLPQPPKVVFFVPTVALVDQQRKMFGRYLSNLRALGLSGDQDGKLPLVDLLREYHVLVLTPQVMENALLAEGIVLLRCFTLMIFDECHHTTKNHPYNAIMAHYVDQILENEGRGRPVNVLPQVWMFSLEFLCLHEYLLEGNRSDVFKFRLSEEKTCCLGCFKSTLLMFKVKRLPRVLLLMTYLQLNTYLSLLNLMHRNFISELGTFFLLTLFLNCWWFALSNSCSKPVLIFCSKLATYSQFCRTILLCLMLGQMNNVPL
jgi:hypothetical protein